MNLLNNFIQVLDENAENACFFAYLTSVEMFDNYKMQLTFDVTNTFTDDPEFFLGSYFINKKRIKNMEHTTIWTKKNTIMFEIVSESWEKIEEVLISPYVIYRNKAEKPLYDAFFETPYFLQLNLINGNLMVQKTNSFVRDKKRITPIEVNIYKEGAENIHWGHEIKSVNAIANVFDHENGLNKESFDIQYCENCDTYFLSNKSYINIVNRRQLLCDYITKDDIWTYQNDKVDRTLILDLI